MDSAKKLVKLLVVGSGPECYLVNNTVEGSDMKKYGTEFYEYIVQNNLINYSIGNYTNVVPFVKIQDLPMNYLKLFVSKTSYKRDFDENRDLIIANVKKFYDKVEEIEYSFVRPHSWEISINFPEFGPSFMNVKDMAKRNDDLSKEKYGINLKLIECINAKFQEYINFCDKTYDIIIFLDCGIPSLYIEINDNYINNFKKICDSGYFINICNVGWIGKVKNDKCLYGSNDYIDFDEIISNLNNIKNNVGTRKTSEHENMWITYHTDLEPKINFLLENVIRVDKGTYKFK